MDIYLTRSLTHCGHSGVDRKDQMYIHRRKSDNNIFDDELFDQLESHAHVP